MNRRLFLVVTGSTLWLAHPTPGTGQDTIPWIGFLSRCPSSFDEQGFKQGLHELGYVEGKNILIEWKRVLEIEAVRPAADELVRANVDLIVTCSTPAAHAALDATKTIPIVFSAVGDPVATGLAASLAKPGANGTGVSMLSTELATKRLDLLRQLAPRARRVVSIVNLSNPVATFQVQPLEAAARTLGIRLDIHNARNAREIDATLHAIPWKSIDGVLIGGDTVFLAQGSKNRPGHSQGKAASSLPGAGVSRVWCGHVIRS